MKQKLLATTVLGACLFLGMQQAKAQWSLTGNAATDTATNFIGTTDNKGLKIKTNNVERMWFGNNGRIGIGTNTPVNTLDILNNTAVTMGIRSLVGGATMSMDRGSATANAAFAYKSLGTVLWNSGMLGNDNFTIRNIVGGANCIVITPANNVAIGTGVPNSKLSVFGNANISAELGIGTAPVTNNSLTIQSGDANYGTMTLMKRVGAGTGEVSWDGGLDGGVIVNHFGNAAGFTAFVGNGNNLMQLNNDGNVGIGTATPATKLDVAGSVKITDGSQGAGKVLTSDSAGLASWQTISFPAETDPKVGTLANNKVPKWNGTALQDGAITDNGTQVAVDVADFDFLKVNTYAGGLKVVNKYTNNETAILKANSGGPFYQAQLELSTLVGYAHLQSPQANAGDTSMLTTSGDMWFRNGSGTVNMAIKKTGEVGVGTTTPAANLDVVGNVKIADGTEGAGKVLTSDSAGLASWQAISFPAETDPKVGTLANNKVPKWNGTTLQDGAITDNGTQVAVDVADFDFLKVNTYAGGLKVVNKYTNNETAILKANSGGPFYQAQLELSTLVGYAHLQSPQANAGDTSMLTTSGDMWFRNGSGTVNMAIKKTGEVGVGTTTPAANLDVVGNVKIADGTEGAGKVLTSDSAGLASWQAISFPAEVDPKVSTVAANQVAKWNGTALVDGIITDNGTNVGIGTTTPTTQFGGQIGLEIKGNVPQVTFSDDQGAYQDDFRITNGGSYAEFSNATSGQTLMTFGLGQFTGLVGVGTSAPTEKLTVVTTGPASGLGIYSNNTGRTGLEIGRNNASDISIGIADAPGSYVSGSVAGDAVFRNNSNTNKLLFAAGGGGAPVTMAVTSKYVGIGTTTPASKLHIVDTTSNVVGALVGLHSPNMPTGGLAGFYFGKNTTFTGNQAEIRYEYYGDLDNRNGYAFGLNNIQPFVRFTRNQRVSIGGNNTPGGQFELSLDQGRKPSTSTWTITSDERLKNIDGAYTKGLDAIMQLNPIKYHYKNVGERKFDAQVLNTQAIGFSAQEVKKIFPESVGTDEDGYLNLNMHAILVAQVNAIKEQQSEIVAQRELINSKDSKINEMQNQINAMQECLESLCQAAQQSTEAKVATPVMQNVLFQNQPNPFNQVTTIRYQLVKADNASQIIIRDLNGNLVKSLDLGNLAKGEVTVNANELAAGTYTYTLVVNNQSVDTKLMVVTK